MAMLLFVLGSYVAAQYVRVWRPRRRGQAVARRASAPPERLDGSRPAGRGDSVLGASA